MASDDKAKRPGVIRLPCEGPLVGSSILELFVLNLMVCTRLAAENPEQIERGFKVKIDKAMFEVAAQTQSQSQS